MQSTGGKKGVDFKEVNQLMIVVFEISFHFSILQMEHDSNMNFLFFSRASNKLSKFFNIFQFYTLIINVEKGS